MLALGEVWHAVLDHRDSLEQGGWEEEDGEGVGELGAAQQPAGGGDPYRGRWAAALCRLCLSKGLLVSVVSWRVAAHILGGPPSCVAWPPTSVAVSN